MGEAVSVLPALLGPGALPPPKAPRYLLSGLNPSRFHCCPSSQGLHVCKPALVVPAVHSCTTRLCHGKDTSVVVSHVLVTAWRGVGAQCVLG